VSADDQLAVESDWRRRQRLAAVFGDALSETTTDERSEDDELGDRRHQSDAWLRDQVPPHHGG
jgi:hypothetical protein